MDNKDITCDDCKESDDTRMSEPGFKKRLEQMKDDALNGVFHGDPGAAKSLWGKNTRIISLDLEMITGGIPKEHLGDEMAPYCGGIFTAQLYHPKETNKVRTPDFCCFDRNFAGDVKHITLEHLSSDKIDQKIISKAIYGAIKHTTDKLGPESLKHIGMSNTRRIAVAAFSPADYRGSADSLIGMIDAYIRNPRTRSVHKVDAIVIWFKPAPALNDEDDESFFPSYIVYTHNPELTDGLFRYDHETRTYRCRRPDLSQLMKKNDSGPRPRPLSNL